jgi:2,4-dienoyl-CoA reductase-like NADH-dependent reductase (Old Yellow Enzyme family)
MLRLKKNYTDLLSPVLLRMMNKYGISQFLITKSNKRNDAEGHQINNREIFC